ncbi:hypothetical protein Syun_014089 [Stephania yunnanensis]|uniref:Mitochondrial protein n=1 Tax=Stephania yunnanensis TaxID=152371 RepID=A0AAP0JIW1_9MAGN
MVIDVYIHLEKFVSRDVFNEIEFPFLSLFQPQHVSLPVSSHGSCPVSLAQHMKPLPVSSSVSSIYPIGCSSPPESLSLISPNVTRVPTTVPSVPIVTTIPHTSPVLPTPTTPLVISTPTTFPVTLVPVVTPIPNVPIDNVHPMVTRSKNDIFKPKALVVQSPYALATQLEPKSVKAALQDHNWHTAMVDEISALNKNHTWTLVPPTFSMNPVGCKWVFKLKTTLLVRFRGTKLGW